MWNSLDHLTIILALGAPLWWVISKVRKAIHRIEENEKRLTALWREHGYNGWNGNERRTRQREFDGEEHV